MIKGEYKVLTEKQIDYLLTAPNRYYFRKLSNDLKSDLETLAKENGRYVIISILSDEERSQSWNKKSRGRPKCAGYIIELHEEREGI